MVEKQTYEELEQRIALLENELDHQKRFEEINRSLLKISDAVNMSSSLDELFQKIHLALEPVIDTSNFFIALYDRTKDSIVFPYCVDTIDESYPPVIDASKTASLTAEVIRTGCPLMLTKTEIETQRAKSRLKIPTCTPSEIWLGVPLKTRDEIIGVMAVQSYHDPMCYDQTDMDVMVSVADQVAIAIERKRIEDAQREREEKYRWLLNNMSDLVAVMDMSLRFTFVSPSIMRMRGYTVEEALTQTFEQIMTPESLQLSAKVFEEELELEASGKADPDRVRIMEVEEYKKDGSIVLMESHLSFMRDEPAKKPVGIISVSHDVTDRRRVEKALRESEEKHKGMIANISDVIAIMDVDGTVRYKSPNVEKWFGWKPEDLVGTDGWETVHPEDMERIQKEFLKLIDKDNSAETVEYRYKCNDGSYKMIELTAVNLTNDPLIRGVLMNYHDITARKQIEKELRESKNFIASVIENIPLMMFLKESTDLRFVLFNRAGEELLGYDRNELLGKNDLDLFPPEQAAHFMVKDRETLDSPTGILDIPEEPINTAKKGQRLLHTKKVCINEGSTKYLLGISEDITERKQEEAEKAQLEVQNRQLQKAESLGRMAGAIAHHFNNQLYAVMGNLEMAMDDLPRGADISETLAEAKKAARKAADVSRLMLTYLGQTPGKNEPIDLSETCRQSQTLLQAAAPKGMILNADFPSYGPIINADAGQMHQILTNLVTNAWEAISDNRGTIGLTVKTVSHVDITTTKRFPIDWQQLEIDYACLEVSDTGSGISNKDNEKIFDPFFTTKFAGRGLGLPVVMGIVKAYGGVVTVESESGRGSVFRVFLPVSTEELPCRHDLPVISEALSTCKAQASSKIESGGTVLLIEDEEQVRNMAKKMLTRLGYTVFEAKDGVEALEVFQQHRDKIRFVLSDLTMPRMNGWDTLAALRKISPETPVILSSGYDEAKVMAEEHTEIPNAFLGKPYQLKGLRETINRVLTNMS